MKLQSKENAIKIWEKNNYIDWNNFHYIDDEYGFYIESIQTFNDTECKTCIIIDDLCDLYYRNFADNSDAQNDEIITKILSNEINVYKLMKLRESMGFSTLQLDGSVQDGKYVEGILDITHYLYSNDYTDEELELMKILDKDINAIRTESARWCRVCGARKPDVYK